MLFVAFVDIVKQKGAGYVDYLWPRPGSSEPVQKITYVQGFAPWGWVIGSGIYVDDVNAVFRNDAIRMSILVAVISLCFWGWAVLIARSIVKPLNEAVSVAQKVAAGDLTSTIEVKTRDETGQLLAALKHMNESLVKIVGEVRSGTDSITTASQGNRLGQRGSVAAHRGAGLQLWRRPPLRWKSSPSTVKQNAENAKQANQLAAGASEVAVKGGTVVGEVVSTMSSINEIVEEDRGHHQRDRRHRVPDQHPRVERGGGSGARRRAGPRLRGGGDRSAQPGAAHRGGGEGDQGADRGLGGQGRGTAPSWWTKPGKTMDEIVSSVKRVTDIMAEITAASQEQSSGIEQVNQAITQMDEVTQQNAALVEEAAAAAESMQEQAQNLAQAVSVFKLDAADAQTAAPQAWRLIPSRQRRCADDAAGESGAQAGMSSRQPGRAPANARTGTDGE